jgi:PAS domain S-box-containing protein
MKPARIFIVEDEGVVALDIQDRLTALGYEVVGSSARGEDALKQIEASLPDLVLMDIRLKGAMDGISVSAVIHERWLLPVVFLTAYSEDSTLERAKRTEPFGFIIKPFDDREIRCVIEMSLYKHQADERLRASERRYATTLKSIGDAVIATDSQGRVTFLNPVAESLTGWPISEACGQPLPQVFHILNEYTRALVENPVERVLREKVVVGLANHTILVSRDGREIHIDDSAAPIFDDQGTISGTVLVFHDVTERRKKEELLRQAERQWHTTFDAINNAVCLLDREGRVLQHNRATETLLGKNTDEIQGHFCYEVVHGASEPIANCPILRMRHTKRRESIIQKWGDRFLEVVVDPVLTTSQEIEGAVHVITDITERKRAEDERLELERRLLHSQKLESLGVLAGGIAHDFNNLLTVILGNLELAEMDISDLSPALSSLREAAQATHRAADLTRQMLAYSGRGKFLIKEINLSELVEEMAHLLKVSVSKFATLQLRVNRQLPNIRADVSQVQQIVMNLITNASEAIGDQMGSITVTTGIEDCDTTYLAQSRLLEKPTPGNYVYVEVADTGCGMDETVQQRLFDPFFTTKFTGRGLGMCAVLGVVRGHQGAIIISSQPTKGTSIRVLFPALLTSSEPPPTPNQAKESPFQHEPSFGTILVVDDEESVRKLTRRALEHTGLSVLCASDGEEAVQIFRENADIIACVVLDLTMPRKDGMQTFAELRDIRPDVPVLLASGFDENELSQRFTGQGLAGFLQKPFNLRKLAKTIQEIRRRE